jgi:hypothetical protein
MNRREADEAMRLARARAAERDAYDAAVKREEIARRVRGRAAFAARFQDACREVATWDVTVTVAGVHAELAKTVIGLRLAHTQERIRAAGLTVHDGVIVRNAVFDAFIRP